MEFLRRNSNNASVYSKLFISIVKANKALRIPITEFQIERAQNLEKDYIRLLDSIRVLLVTRGRKHPLK